MCFLNKVLSLAVSQPKISVYSCIFTSWIICTFEFQPFWQLTLPDWGYYQLPLTQAIIISGVLSINTYCGAYWMLHESKKIASISATISISLVILFSSLSIEKRGVRPEEENRVKDEAAARWRSFWCKARKRKNRRIKAGRQTTWVEPLDWYQPIETWNKRFSGSTKFGLKPDWEIIHLEYVTYKPAI